MKIKEKAKAKIPPVAPGTYAAVCVYVIDLGEQYSEKFKTYSPKVKIGWELDSEKVEIDGELQPRILSKDFTFSANKKSSLRAFISSWNGRQYSDDEFANLEIFDQLGKPCLLQVVLNDSGEYANIDSVMALMKGMAPLKPASELIAWDMEKWDDDLFDKLPPWAQEQIQKSTEYQKAHAPQTEIKVTDAPVTVNAETGEVCPI